jgi:hypothetical protein
MDENLYVQRNDALVFARHTRVNLEYIEAARQAQEDVHLVTQLANSLLGLVVFLCERNFVEHIKDVTLADLYNKGWPRINIVKGDCQTLGGLIRRLRNAAAHGRIKFSSDSQKLVEVVIEVEDRKGRQSVPDWCARMTAEDLRTFCLKFTELLENTIG